MPRFMLFMYPGLSTEEYEGGPTLDAVEAMNRYNEELTQAGALLAADGLRPQATRVRHDSVTDGPFSEAKELVGGYWIIQAKDFAEAVEWAKRVPIGPGPFVEVREMWEVTDMPEEIQAAAKLSAAPPQQTSA